ncbi:hypothetical protein DPMN_148799 [Dreissena polymorpha]|uniref:Uncharacterized protein n=1 Tax=Dreissena polymorpha TaxID=45954 RepID=A0A9D4FES8_DREPO|nr:hypothetical protein DPMN_148799 [Dreissena polymorpha]
MAQQRPTHIPTPHRCYIKRQFWVGKAYVVVALGWVIWTWMFEIDSVVIRDAWSMWAGRPRVDRVVIRDIHAPGLVMGPCIVEIDRFVIRDVQYQFTVNRCRNEEVYVKYPKHMSDNLLPDPTEKSYI